MSLTNKNANGATGYSKDSVEACKTQCLSMPNCVALGSDPASTTQKCWILIDIGKANKLSNAPGVTHYLRIKCPTPGELCANCITNISFPLRLP